MADKKHQKFSGTFIKLNPDLILVKLSGDVKCEECLEDFKKFSDDLDKEILRIHRDIGAKVNQIIDVSQVTSYGVEAFQYLEKSAAKTKDYENKTAIIGANYSIELFADSLSALSGHQDIKFFKTKEEALEWFKE